MGWASVCPVQASAKPGLKQPESERTLCASKATMVWINPDNRASTRLTLPLVTTAVEAMAVSSRLRGDEVINTETGLGRDPRADIF